MINLYFGKPGSGKTTLLAKKAVTEIKKIDKYSKAGKLYKFFVSKPKYDYIVSNVKLKGCVYAEFKDLAKYRFDKCLLLFDEITLDADSRDFKSFSKGLKEAIVMHRHYKNDIYVYTQMYDRMDKTIRDNVNNCYHITKLFGVFTVKTLIPSDIIIPEQTGEIVQGYRKPMFIEKLMNRSFIFRPKYYKYFDSYYVKTSNRDYPYKSMVI